MPQKFTQTAKKLVAFDYILSYIESSTKTHFKPKGLAMNPQLVYLRFSKKQISATLAYLKWMKAFIASDKALAKIPGDWFDRTMTKEEARKRYSFMIHQAINYKAGINPQGRNFSSEAEAEFRRDVQILAFIRQGARMYQFCSKHCQKRLGYLLSEREF